MLALARCAQWTLCLALLLATNSLSAQQDPAAAGPNAVTYEALVQLLRTGKSEQEILKLLEKSPIDVSFVLGNSQVAELKKMRVSDEFLEDVQKLLQKQPKAPASDVTDLVVILDCSGSMLDRTKDGSTKMEAAKQVVTELVRDFPSGRRLAFVVYGHDRRLQCQAAQVVRPLSDLDDDGRTELMKYISRLQPSGHTPIARALELATPEVAKAKGLSRVVLITDGLETCHGDPVKMATALVEATKAEVDVIGFGLKPEESRAIDRIAQAGRGNFYDVQTAEKLRKDLRKAAQVPAQPEKKTEVVARRVPLEDELGILKGHKHTVVRVGFMSDGRVLSACDDDFTVRQWDADSLKELEDRQIKSYIPHAAVFSPDGRLLLHSFGQSATITKLETKKPLYTINPVGPHIFCKAFSGNSRRFAIGYDEIFTKTYVGVWDAKTGKSVQLYKDYDESQEVKAIALSSDGRLAASADFKEGIRLWEVDSGKELRRLDRQGILCMAFSPNDKFLVTGEKLDTVILWDVDTGKELRQIEGHDGEIHSVAFSADGRYLLTGGEDKAIRLWDAGSGEELHRFEGHTDEVTSLAFSADGSRAVSGSKDKTVRLWNIAKHTVAPR